MNLLKGKTGLVTGASGAIGGAIALSLSDEGANVIVNYRTREKEALEIVSRIKEKGCDAIALRADIGDFSQVESMVAVALDKFGSIDILVNNATLHRGGRVHKIPLEDWDVVVKSCLYGAFYCCRCVVPAMMEKKWGRIINISSGVGERGFPGDTAYGAAKAGLVGFTKSLAREVAKYNITVNTVMPGFVLSETVKKNLSEKNFDQIKAGIMLGRPCEPEEVAALVTFLVTKGDYITASIHHVDGGTLF